MGDIKTMQDRLLDAYMKTAIDEAKFSAKSLELRQEEQALQRQLSESGGLETPLGNVAVAVFDFAQTAASKWASATPSQRREILQAVILNG